MDLNKQAYSLIFYHYFGKEICFDYTLYTIESKTTTQSLTCMNISYSWENMSLLLQHKQRMFIFENAFLIKKLS